MAKELWFLEEELISCLLEQSALLQCVFSHAMYNPFGCLSSLAWTNLTDAKAKKMKASTMKYSASVYVGWPSFQRPTLSTRHHMTEHGWCWATLRWTTCATQLPGQWMRFDPLLLVLQVKHSNQWDPPQAVSHDWPMGRTIIFLTDNLFASALACRIFCVYRWFSVTHDIVA